MTSTYLLILSFLATGMAALTYVLIMIIQKHYARNWTNRTILGCACLLLLFIWGGTLHAIMYGTRFEMGISFAACTIGLLMALIYYGVAKSLHSNEAASPIFYILFIALSAGSATTLFYI